MAFDDFAQQRASDQQKRDRLAKETKTEWEILKGFVSQFAMDEKTIDGYRFAWSTDLIGRPLLILNDVSATLIGGERIGLATDYQVMFSRKPPGAHEAYVDDSRVHSTTWELKADIVNDNFVWCINNDPGISAPLIADAIAEKLARYHIEYQKAYGRAS